MDIETGHTAQQNTRRSLAVVAAIVIPIELFCAVASFRIDRDAVSVSAVLTSYASLATIAGLLAIAFVAGYQISPLFTFRDLQSRQRSLVISGFSTFIVSSGFTAVALMSGRPTTGNVLYLIFLTVVFAGIGFQGLRFAVGHHPQSRIDYLRQKALEALHSNRSSDSFFETLPFEEQLEMCIAQNNSRVFENTLTAIIEIFEFYIKERRNPGHDLKTTTRASTLVAQSLSNTRHSLTMQRAAAKALVELIVVCLRYQETIISEAIVKDFEHVMAVNTEIFLVILEAIRSEIDRNSLGNAFDEWAVQNVGILTPSADSTGKVPATALSILLDMCRCLAERGEEISQLLEKMPSQSSWSITQALTSDFERFVTMALRRPESRRSLLEYFRSQMEKGTARSSFVEILFREGHLQDVPDAFEKTFEREFATRPGLPPSVLNIYTKFQFNHLPQSKKSILRLARDPSSLFTHALIHAIEQSGDDLSEEQRESIIDILLEILEGGIVFNFAPAIHESAKLLQNFATHSEEAQRVIEGIERILHRSSFRLNETYIGMLFQHLINLRSKLDSKGRTQLSNTFFRLGLDAIEESRIAELHGCSNGIGWVCLSKINSGQVDFGTDVNHLKELYNTAKQANIRKVDLIFILTAFVILTAYALKHKNMPTANRIKSSLMSIPPDELEAAITFRTNWAHEWESELGERSRDLLREAAALLRPKPAALDANSPEVSRPVPKRKRGK